MSSAHDAHGAATPAHHDHDHFDGEPTNELSPGEPRTPGWLPALGLALFTAAAVWMLVGSDAEGAGSAQLAAEQKPIAAAPAPEAPAAAEPIMRPRPQAGAEPQPAGSAVRKLTPQQVDDLKKRIEEARAKGVLPKQEPGK